MAVADLSMQHFVFRQAWRVPAGLPEVYAVLADIADYPRWWREVKTVRQVAEASAAMQIRSFLPYTLELVLTRETEDEQTRLLRVEISGDLEGWSQWQLREAPEAGGPEGGRKEAGGLGVGGLGVGGMGVGGIGTVAEFTQDVIVSGDLLGRVAGVAAPLMRANHAAMMRSGERGLTRRLTAD